MHSPTTRELVEEERVLLRQLSRRQGATWLALLPLLGLVACGLVVGGRPLLIAAAVAFAGATYGFSRVGATSKRMTDAMHRIDHLEGRKPTLYDRSYYFHGTPPR